MRGHSIPDKHFRKCKICGVDYSGSKNPKLSLTHHLRHAHREEFEGNLANGYLLRFVLKGSAPKCAYSQCKNKVSLNGFQFIQDCCSPKCSSLWKIEKGESTFADPELVSNRSLAQWADPKFKKKMKAIHNTVEAKTQKSKSFKKMWKDPAIREHLTETRKQEWVELRKDKAFMKKRSEASSKNATHLLRHNPNFGYTVARGGIEYEGYKMRSSWEVELAKKLDQFGVEWQYEPQSFVVQSGVRYTPDFFLPKKGLWIEVKPRKFANERARMKLKRLRELTGQRAKFVDLKSIKELRKDQVA